MNVHHATVSVFSDKASAPSMRQALVHMLPQGAEIEERAIEPETEGGVFKSELVELRCRLTKASDIKAVASKVFGALDGYDMRMLRERIEDFVDDDCVLYVRLSKEEAMRGRMVLEYKDPVHVSFKLEAYPARKENAFAAARGLLDEIH